MSTATAVLATSETSAGANLAAWFSARARVNPERPAVTFEGVTQTYGELDNRVRRLAGALRAGGVAPGERVGFLGNNQPQLLEGLMATAAVGAVYVPLNFRCTGSELAFMITDAGVHTLLVDNAHRATIDAVRDDLVSVARYICVDETRTRVGELDDQIRRLVGALRAGGVAAGDRVGFLGRNQPQVLEGLMAAADLGAVYVPLNLRLTGSELVSMVDDAGVSTLLVDDTHRAAVDAVRDDLASVGRCLWVDAIRAGWEALEELLADSDPIMDFKLASPGAAAVIMYTSGTTGRPKGATLSHSALWWNNLNVLTTLDLGYDDISLVAAPLFHIGGLNAITLATWIKGGHLVIHRSFNPGATLAAIAESRVTTLFAVPAMFQLIAADPSFKTADLSSIRCCVCGGAPLPEGLIRTYLARGVSFAQGYGLTEASPMLAFLTSEYALSKLGSTGRPPMFCEIAIVDADGHHLTEPGAVGEIWARGPMIMLGYHNNPEATAAAIDPHGWLHTGDGGYRDADGFLYVSDRIKDMIISGGENIYPAEIESVLFDHPAIAEAAVIGVADEQWGEAVCAVIAVNADAVPPNLQDLRDFLGRSLARYKLPKRIEIIDALPRSPTGKILKVELRRQYH